MQYWLVTVEKLATGKRQSRRIKAASPEDAGRLTCELIGGPGTAAYRVIFCNPG